jgi:pyridoxamine 5'-phosphate oxidase-like protein
MPGRGRATATGLTGGAARRYGSPMSGHEDAERLAEVQRSSYEHASATVHSSWPPGSAMDAAQLDRFLDDHRHAVVATTRPSNRPQVTPLAFLVHRGSFWFASVAGQRLKNLAYVPYLALVVTDGEPAEGRMLVAEGPATLRELTPELADRWFERHGSSPAWAASMIEMTPERIFSYRR